MRLKKLAGYGGLKKHTAQGASYVAGPSNQYVRRRKRVPGEPVDIHN